MPKRKNSNPAVPLYQSNPEATLEWLAALLVCSAQKDTEQARAAAGLPALVRPKPKAPRPPKSQSKYNHPYRGPLPKSRFVAKSAIVDQAKMERLGIEWATQADTGKILMRLDDWTKASEAGAVCEVSTG
jgi:hypothetical protein